MEDYYTFFSLLIIVIVVVLISLVRWSSVYYLIIRRSHNNHRSSEVEKKKKQQQLPPGPKPLPLLGNILFLGINNGLDKPHRSFFELSKTYGPILTLRLGCVTTVVVSSSDAARELFLNHDLAISSRKNPSASRSLDHHNHSMVWLPVDSPKWKALRKVTATQLLTNSQLNGRTSRSLREKAVLELVAYVDNCSRNREAVSIGEAGFTTAINLLSNTIFSTEMRGSGYGSEWSRELKETVFEVMVALGKVNVADLFPVLDWFDPMGLRRKGTVNFRKLFRVFDDIIARRLSDNSAKDDVLEKLLDISSSGRSSASTDGESISFDDINHLLLDLFAAGTDTTSSTVEWAMTELLINPSKLAKAQAELRQQLVAVAISASSHDQQQLLVRESDISKLPYLQAVVKETLRLHPPAPFLPRKTETDVVVDFNGSYYHVPNNAQVLVNVWAIGRDQTKWKDPTTFLPERFIDQHDHIDHDHRINFRGRDFKFLPFGSGRKICPGMALGDRMLHLMLANLLYSFDWKLGNGMNKQDVDMTEKFGLSVHKAQPLLALPIRHPIQSNPIQSNPILKPSLLAR